VVDYEIGVGSQLVRSLYIAPVLQYICSYYSNPAILKSWGGHNGAGNSPTYSWCALLDSLGHADTCVDMVYHIYHEGNYAVGTSMPMRVYASNYAVGYDPAGIVWNLVNAVDMPITSPGAGTLVTAVFYTGHLIGNSMFNIRLRPNGVATTKLYFSMIRAKLVGI
jgi:hypothetical protein